MHHKYHTEAIVLETILSKEADMTYFILTKEFGLVYAVSHGVRNIKSKNRYSLQIGSFSLIDLIKTRDMWQITSAIYLNDYNIIFKSKEGRVLWSKFVLVLKKIAPKNDANDDLWKTSVLFLVTLDYLIESNAPEKVIDNLEIYFIHTILSFLGYTKRHDEFVLSKDYILSFIKDKMDTNIYKKEINRAFRESHL